VCAALVGQRGSVTGVDMTQAQLAVARKYADEYCSQVRGVAVQGCWCGGALR
jgi:ubiquinone/menaquinone biosynthesis C-methylase UbiE